MEKSKVKPTDPMADITMPNGYGVRDRGAGKSVQFLHDRDRVAEHIARVVIKNNLNFEAAVAQMSPKKLTDAQISVQANILMRSPKVQAKLQLLYVEIGIDDESFKKYWSILWQWMLGGDRPRAVTAAKLLGSIFGVTEKADESKKVQPLPIKGIAEGLAKMGVTPQTNPTGFKHEEQNFDEEEQDD